MAASWECPSLPMLNFPLKESAQTTFLAMKPMISAHYEEDGDSFGDEIKQLDALRQSALHPPKDYNGVSMLRRYFGQLHLIRERFPTETIGQLPIDFVWKDAHTDAQYVQEGLQIEQASILYNISALHSMLGCRVKRSNEQEMKEAVTHFQCAAGAYTYLDEHFAVNHASKDLGAQFVSLYKDLMLGQAQECLVEKSLKGVGRVKNNTIAKLAIRVSEYYLNVSRLLETDPCNVIVKKHKDWPKLFRMKVFYYQAISHFYQGCAAEEQSRQGELIAWLQLSLQKLTAIGKIPKSLGDLREAAKKFFDHVNDRLQVVKRQNDQVYHAPIPEPDTLEQTTGADLVKPITFQPSDSKNVGRDIFARLVPMRAYEAASVYSEEKAKLLRSVVSSVQEKDEELQQYLLSLNAGEVEKLHQGSPSIPDEVLQQHKLLQGKSTLVKKMHADLQELVKLSTEVGDDLTLIAEKKKEDTNNEETFQNRHGERSPSQITASLWKEAENFSKFHSQASKSNAELKSMFSQHYQYLLLLSGPIATLQAAVPRITALDTPIENSQDSEQWKKLMGKIEEMKKQRKALIGQLRDQINRDDITKTLIGHLGSDKEVFISEQMRQHREISDIVRKNLEAQENILGAVTEANAKKAQVRQTVQELTQQQETMFASLVKAGTTFPLLQSKISEGLGFYARLHGNMSKLRKRVLDVVAARDSERESTERRRTPDRSRSPSPSPFRQTMPPPPPRPPKKAEFAGNPLAPEQHALLNNEAHRHVTPPLGGQGSPTHGHTHQSLTPPPQPPAGQSLEEQLQDLQQQQQMQLQALQNLNVPNGGGLDLQAVQNIITPNQSLPVQLLPGTGQLPQGLPRLSPSPGNQQSVQSPPLPEMMNQQIPPLRMPTQQVSPPGMPTQQVPPLGVPTQQVPPLGMPTQQVPPLGMPTQQIQGMPTQQLMGHVTSPPPNLLGLETGGQQFLQAPLQPADSGINQDTMQAIEDLQLLLQPPGLVGMGDKIEHFQPPNITQSQPPERGVTMEQAHESQVPTEHTIENMEKLMTNEQLPSGHVLEQDHRGNEFVTPQFDDMEPAVSEGEMQPEPGSTLPDVLQVRTGPVELEKPVDLDVTNSHDGYHGGLPTGMMMTQPVNETTITINSISRPIPAPIQSPPPDHTHTPTLESMIDTQLHHQMVLPPLPSDTDHGHIDESTAQEYTQNEPVGFQPITDLVSSLDEPNSNLTLTEDISLRTEMEPSPQPVANPEPIVTQAVSHDQHVVIQEEPGLPAMGSPLTELPPEINTQILNMEQPASTTGLTFRPITTEPLPNSVPELSTPTAAIDDNLSSSSSSLPQMSESISSFQPFVTLPPAPLSLPTPPSVSPLPPELTMPLQEYHTTLSSIATVSHFDTSHFETQLTKKDEKIDKLKFENSSQKAQISDQRIQVESYKQQLLLLQQQVSQVSVQQQKHEQEKMASSGQQAVLMQLLQQQQGMFSQQQAQLENMGKVTEAHRKEQQELESSYKQALAVEKEQKNSLQNQLMQQTQEMQRLQQQLQSHAQQYQTLQLQLHQYHTQIGERDKQLVAFRDQHKTIIQSMDQKHQQKVTQLVQQLQEYQTEVKKLRAQKQQSGIMTPLQPVPAQQFMGQMRPTRPASGPGQMHRNAPSPNVPGQMAPPVNFPTQVLPNRTPPTPVTPSTQQQVYNQQTPRPLVPQPVRAPPPNQPRNFSGGTGPPQGLPPPMQPTPTQGYGRQESQPMFQGFQQGQNFQSPQQQGGTGQSFQPPQAPTSQPSQTGGGQMMRQDSQPFRTEQQPPSKEIPPTSSYGFMPRQEGPQAWQAGGNRMPHLPNIPQGVGPQPAGQGQYGPMPPGVQPGQTPHSQQGPPQQFQSPGGQFHPEPQFQPSPQQPNPYSQHKPM